MLRHRLWGREVSSRCGAWLVECGRPLGQTKAQLLHLEPQVIKVSKTILFATSADVSNNHDD
jgi:hypothetical protein